MKNTPFTTNFFLKKEDFRFLKTKILFLVLITMLSKVASGQAPAINFTFTTGTINPGDTVTFTNTSTGFPAGTQFIWNFGELCYIPSNPDSVDMTLCNDTTIGVSQNINYAFHNRKPYVVSLMAYDANNLQYKISQWVIVQSLCTCNPTSCFDFVCNGDFNEIDFCYTSGAFLGSYNGQNYSSTCWYSPNPSSSPFLFMDITCTLLPSGASQTNSDVNNMPQTCNQPDHSTTSPIVHGYAQLYGLTINNPFGPNYRSYLQQHIAPLQPGDYDVSFFCNLRDWALNACNIGMLLSSAPPNFLTIPGLTDIIDITGGGPQITANGANAITDKSGWQEVHNKFTSAGEEYITIGNFDQDNNGPIWVGNNGPCPIPILSLPYWQSAAYLIDDVSITKHLELATTVTPACDGVLNGTIKINSVDGTFSPYTFTWSNGMTTQNISGLAGGTYTVTVTDNAGCPKEFTYAVASGISPEIPEVDGDHYGCTIQNCFMVLNPVAGCSYT